MSSCTDCFIEANSPDYCTKRLMITCTMTLRSKCSNLHTCAAPVHPPHIRSDTNLNSRIV